MLRRIAALASLALAASAFADRLPDAFNDTTRNGALWTEAESASATGCKVAETGTKLRFTSQGLASGASYLFTKRIDWNDGFVIDWSQSSNISPSIYATRNGRAGLAIGWGAFDNRTGFSEGINVEVVRTKTWRRLVLSLRKGGVTVDTAAVTIGTFEYDYRLVVSSGIGISIDVFRDGETSPVLSMDGLETVFGNRMASGMAAALIASSHNTVTLDCRLDDFKFWGDQFDDSTDRLMNDSDGANDDDDEDGYDDSPDEADEDEEGDDDSGDDDGDGDDDDGDDDGDDGASSLAGPDFIAAVNAATGGNGLPILEAETDRVGAALAVEVLQWNQATGRLLKTRVNATTLAVLSTSSWVPTAFQLARIQPELDALDDVTVSMADAVDFALSIPAGSTMYEIEIDVEGGLPYWKAETRSPAGAKLEKRIRADQPL